uniref:Neurotransmitter-gated ion-channel ligand-binding domain-containing protein n=1 Tax=Branchiostoma floridae TaxID=7739 RepID=C3ZKC6_BRAFL|eukprot:XP_002591014.1 hypothetical protein BRAFLDRAFT_69433 [Branchiostoma floridae]
MLLCVGSKKVPKRGTCGSSAFSEDVASAQDRHTEGQTDTMENLLQRRGYDRFLRPNFGREPVHVNLSLTVASIDLISEVNMPAEPVQHHGNNELEASKDSATGLRLVSSYCHTP